MVVSLRRHLVIIMLVLTLLAGLMGWTMKVFTSPTPYPHIVTHGTSLGFIPMGPCLPPPIYC